MCTGADSNTKDIGVDMASELVEKERNRIIQVIQDRNEFECDVDGFVYYWPNGYGSLASHHLRWIADELDKMNEPITKEIEEYFRLHPVDNTVSETEFFD